MKGYKGFDKNFRCRGFQFKVGETYKIDDKIKICERGFHFCDEPLAVFEYYPPANSRFALVEAIGDVVDDGKHKFCTNKLVIIKEVTLDELIKAVANTKVATNTGDWSAATNTGDWSAATNTGCCSVAINTGGWSAAIATGENSVAVVTGRQSRAKGALGCWLVLGEWAEDELSDVQAFKVDGKKIKPDTFYKLQDGRAIEA